MAKLLSDKALEAIKSRIKDEMTKRGIHVEILKFEELDSERGNKIVFETDYFQTVPVIFKTLNLRSYTSGVFESKEVESEVNVWVSVNYNYTHFGGGSNGCSLFDFHCKVIDDTIYKVKIR